MKLVIHDIKDDLYTGKHNSQVIYADARYAPCQGCFHCWTKHPASCDLKDRLQEICRKVGMADDLVIITENWYGGYSPAVKNILDRAIGASTPFSTYRGGQMHHTLRYGKHNCLKVFAYGDISDAEEKTLRLTAERNAVNYGYQTYEFVRLDSVKDLEDMDL